MSILARVAVEKNLEAIRKQLSSIGGGNDELHELESRLATEKNLFVRNLIFERAERLKKGQKGPSVYEAHADKLRDIEKHLKAAHDTMLTVPFYMKATRGKQKGAPKAAAKKRAK